MAKQIGQHWIWYVLALALVIFAAYNMDNFQAETIVPVCEDKSPTVSGNVYTWGSGDILEFEAVTDCFSNINGTKNSTLNGKVVFQIPNEYPNLCSDNGMTRIYGSSEGIRQRIATEITPLINLTDMVAKVLTWKINVCGTKDQCSTNAECGASSICDVATQTCKALTCLAGQEVVNRTCLYEDRCTTSTECISTESCVSNRCQPLNCGEKQILENHACRAVSCTKNEHCVKTADFDCNMENETVTGTCSSYACTFKEEEKCSKYKAYWNHYIGDYISFDYWYYVVAGLAVALYYANRRYKWIKT